MTTETILTPVQVDSLLEDVLRASGSRLGNYTYQKTLNELRSSIRAIEQAVLQSSEVQAWKRDAELFQFLLEEAWFQSAFDRFDPDDNGIQRKFESECRRILSAAMEKQT